MLTISNMLNIYIPLILSTLYHFTADTRSTTSTSLFIPKKRGFISRHHPPLCCYVPIEDKTVELQVN